MRSSIGLYILFGVCINIATHKTVLGFDFEMTSSDASMYQYASQSMKAVENWSKIVHHGFTLRTIKECYEHVGCFWSNGTFKYIWSIPSSPDDIDTKLLLYTHDNPDEPQRLDYRNITTLMESNLQKGKPIKIICHGFGGSSKLIWVQDMKNAFLEKLKDVQVIVVDWSKGAAIPNYLSGVANTELVGRQVAVLLNQIRIHYGINWDDMHMVGFSLGAQVAGFVGKSTQAMFHGKLARITALDAAAPLFEGYGPSVHVDPSDAKFVDSIHTNADSTIKAGCGMKDPIGHVDFYPNGGRNQPGCSHYTITGFFKDLFTGNKEKECHHMRAVRLYIESIREDCSFISYPCSDYEQYEQNKCFMCTNGKCGNMGYRVEGSGTHYTTTTGEPPYCALPLLLTVVSSDNQEKTFGQLEMALYANNGYKEVYNLTEERGNLQPGGVAVKHVNSSPKMKSLTKVEVTYKPFSGYFRSGNPQWKLSHVVAMTPSGPLFTACNSEVELDSLMPQVIAPTKNEC